MEPGNTNKYVGNKSDEMGKSRSVQPDKNAQPTQSGSLVGERIKVLEDGSSPIKGTASAHINFEDFVSPHATVDLVACHCRCTRTSKSGFMNGENFDGLRDEVRGPSKTYGLASSSNSDDFFSNSANNSLSRAMHVAESWRTPRACQSESQPDIQSLFLEYQSDQSDGDTASEEDIFGYTLSNINTDESTSQEANEDDADSKYMSDTAGDSDMGDRYAEEDTDSDEAL